MADYELVTACAAGVTAVKGRARTRGPHAGLPARLPGLGCSGVSGAIPSRMHHVRRLCALLRRPTEAEAVP
eukprot:10918485-Alexandrium_andersonii.AAC.1